MKVLGVACSPRHRSNTELLVEEALGAARELGAETELFLAAHKSIAPCDGCDICQRGDVGCSIDDDMQELYEKLLEADGIILGSPVYYWGVSAQAKAVLDRGYRFRQRKELTGKVGGALVVARNRGESTALSAFLAWFNSQRILAVAGATARGDDPGDVLRSPAAMEEARRVGRAVANVVLATRPAAARGREG